MIRTRVLLLVSLLVAFAAGTTAGLVAARSEQAPGHHSWLMSELNLTSQQRDQMRKIWAETTDGRSRQHSDQRKALAEERDKAIAALLSPEQQPKYDQVLQDYNRKVGELAQERKRAFEQAVERTKQILTPEQALRYDELLKKQRERGSGGPGSRSQRGGPGSTGSRTRPASD